MPKKQSDISQITIMQLVSQLRISQLWSVVIVIAGLLGGSFSLGYKLSSSVAEPKIVELEAQVGTLREHFRGLESKERFLALYVRYLFAKESLAHVNTPENQQALEDTKEAFENYLFNLWQRHEEAEEDFEIKGLIVGKGPHPTEATVKFLYDNTIWPIPPEFTLSALEK